MCPHFIMSEWKLLAKRADFDQIASRYGIDPVVARIIRNRDIINDEDIDMFLNGTRDNLRDASQMTDMMKACSLIQQYISEDLSFRIIGDYDVDGICSTYILLKGLAACGADVDYAIPHRIHDGYGINDSLIDVAAEEFVDVIITCDNGIAASSQIEHANSLGMHVIVTDHHEVPFEEDEESGERIEILPPAEAVVDPHREGDNYGFSGICGAVVAWKLVGLLLPMCGISEPETSALMDELIEEAALATVCDVMELRDENRIIVKEGLLRSNTHPNTGLKNLIRVKGLEGKTIQSYSYSFVLGPCLNASGRLDSASRSLELLLAEDEYEAARIASELNSYNEERKEMTDNAIRKAMEDIENSPIGRDKVLVVYLPDTHESVAGLVAGKLRERYEKPCFVLTDGEEGIKGSGRSIDNYNMFEEMSRHKELFSKFGGHKMAAGLTLAGDLIDEFRTAINETCTLESEDLVTKILIDVELPFGYVTEDFIKGLSVLEPFGVGNEKPVFAQRNLRISGLQKGSSDRAPVTVRILDSRGHGYSLKLFDHEDTLEKRLTTKYGEGVYEALLKGGENSVIMDVIYSPKINIYNGRTYTDLLINDYRFK